MGGVCDLTGFSLVRGGMAMRLNGGMVRVRRRALPLRSVAVSERMRTCLSV